MITITERAAAKVREFAEQEKVTGQALRVRVIGGGCSGLSYDLHFEDKFTDADEQFESNGVAFCVDERSALYLEGAEIDYVETAMGGGFKFNNPNIKGTCGCGSSFSI